MAPPKGGSPATGGDRLPYGARDKIKHAEQSNLEEFHSAQAALEKAKRKNDNDGYEVAVRKRAQGALMCSGSLLGALGPLLLLRMRMRDLASASVSY